MVRYRINLVTATDCANFVAAVEHLEGKIYLEDGQGLRVNGKSLLGTIATIEWNNVYCISENGIYTKISKWVI